MCNIKLVGIILIGLMVLGCKHSPSLIVLNYHDTVAINMPITVQYIDFVKNVILQKDKINPPGHPLYIVLYTPGGSVYAGSELIQLLQIIKEKRPVVSITQVAYSMGFIISQYTDKRYITRNGSMMAHSAYIPYISGTYPGTLKSRVQYITERLDSLLRPIAKRMGLSFEDFLQEIQHEIWVNASQAINKNMADAIIDVTCGDSLNGSFIVPYQYFDKMVYYEFHDCPLILEPINVIQDIN